MPAIQATHFPFIYAHKAVQEACDWLDEINAPTGRCPSLDAIEALDAAQVYFAQALTIFDAYIDASGDRAFLAKYGKNLLYKTTVNDAIAGKEMLQKMVKGIMDSDMPPSTLTSGIILAIRNFLGMNFSMILSSERLVMDELESIEC